MSKVNGEKITIRKYEIQFIRLQETRRPTCKKREKLPGDRKVFFAYQLFSEHLLRSKSCCNLLLLGAESFSSELPTTSLNPLLLTI